MPINWDELNETAKEATNAAVKKTDTILASKISSLTRLTDEEIMELFPTSSDVEKLSKLMQVVKSAQDRNEKINSIVNNIEEFGGVLLTIVSKFM